MPDVIDGVRDTANIQQSKIVVDMSNEIALLEPNESPFMSFMKLSKKNVKVANSFKFEWLEDDLLPRWDAINNVAGYDTDDTSIIVDNGVYFSKGDVVKVPRTGEAILVTAVATNTLTVVRGYGTTAGAAIVDNDPLVIIGNANEEGSGTRDIKTTKESAVYNYTQIFKTPFGVTNTQAATKMYGGKDLSYQQRKAGVQHKIDIARSFMFGEKKSETTDGQPRRTTGGLLSFLSKNNYDAAGALTESEFDNNVAETIFKFGNKTKILLCSARLISVINGWGKGKLQINNQAAKYGLKIFDYITPFGTFHMMNEQRILEGAVYGGYGVVVDPEYVFFRPLQGRDTKLETNIQANDEDQRKDQYITECGLEVRNAECHGVITGVTG